jgi:ribosome maturation factor RimP
VDQEALVAPVVDDAGLELVDLTFGREGGRKVMRIVVDRDGGVDLDTIATVSQQLSRTLDAEGFDPGTYALEVSSPGLERPLKRPAHYARVLGQKVRVKPADPGEGRRSLTGTLVAADGEGFVLSIEGEERRLAYGAVASARTVVDWDAELKRSTR